jgi:hypothetical protein
MITMALHIVIAYAVGLIGGNLLLSGLTDGLGMALLPGAFLASLPFAVVALLIGSPLHRQIDRYMLPLSVLVIAGVGVIVYLVLGDSGWGATSVFRTTAVILSVACTGIACLTLFILRRAFSRGGADSAGSP